MSSDTEHAPDAGRRSPVLRVVAHDRFTHHGSRSGYLQVLPHLRSCAEVTVIHLPLPRRGLRTALEWWRSRSATADADAELHVYPEQTLFPRLASKLVVAICHQPPERYLSYLPRDALLRLALRSAAVVIALGPNQARGLTALNSRVHFIPHGVDTEWFSPAGNDVKEGRYTVVRGWLRDANRQAAFVDLARTLGGRVVEIGRGAPWMSDHEYRAAVRDSTAMLLWISRGVASNAVLEAASCGKPVLGKLSADLQSYVSEANREILSRPVDAQLATSPRELADVGGANREYVLSHYAWPDVAARLLSIIYGSIG
jgi:hypothetical protein